MNALELDAGPELSALVSEKVMGEKVFRGAEVWEEISQPVAPSYAPMYAIVGFTKESYLVKHEDPLWPYRGCPPYSTDIGAAWKVAEKMDLFRAQKIVLTKGYVEGWIVLELEQELRHPIAEGATPELAICRAALKMAAERSGEKE